MLTNPGGPFAPTFASIIDAIRSLQQPKQPTRFASVLQADLPPAASWPFAAIYVSDLDTLAISTGSTWVRADGSAL